MQAAFQKYTDNAVSKTVNFPNDATRDEVMEVYELAYELELKGVTIYRDGSREAQVLNIGKVNRGGGKKAPETPEMEEKNEKVTPRVRPELTQGITQKVKIGCGNLYITVNYDENGICEVFTNLGRGGRLPFTVRGDGGGLFPLRCARESMCVRSLSNCGESGVIPPFEREM